MAEYLVTGGAGFIGSGIVRALAARGATARVLDDFSSGRRANLDGLGETVEVVEADVRDRAALRRALAGVRVVFHEAALVSVPLSISLAIASGATPRFSITKASSCSTTSATNPSAGFCPT